MVVNIGRQELLGAGLEAGFHRSCLVGDNGRKARIAQQNYTLKRYMPLITHLNRDFPLSLASWWPAIYKSVHRTQKYSNYNPWLDSEVF